MPRLRTYRDFTSMTPLYLHQAVLTQKGNFIFFPHYFYYQVKIPTSQYWMSTGYALITRYCCMPNFANNLHIREFWQTYTTYTIFIITQSSTYIPPPPFLTLYREICFCYPFWFPIYEDNEILMKVQILQVPILVMEVKKISLLQCLLCNI
jgi:hypothetical protein